MPLRHARQADDFCCAEEKYFSCALGEEVMYVSHLSLPVTDQKKKKSMQTLESVPAMLLGKADLYHSRPPCLKSLCNKWPG